MYLGTLINHGLVMPYKAIVYIGSDNYLSPVRRQTITRNDADLLSIGSLRRVSSEIWFNVQNLSFRKIRFKLLSAKYPPFCFGLNGLNMKFEQL